LGAGSEFVAKFHTVHHHYAVKHSGRRYVPRGC
jgi:hypothetical protein